MFAPASPKTTRPHLRRFTRGAKWALGSAWLVTLLAIALGWYLDRDHPRTLWLQTPDRRTAVVLDSFAGQGLLVFLHLSDARIDEHDLWHTPGSYGASVTWVPDAAPELRHRSGDFPLINPAGEYGLYDWPYGADGPFQTATFAGGLLKLAAGREKFHTPSKYAPHILYAQVILPCWLALILFGLIPATFLARPTARALRRRWFHRAGHCPACGYDLRASPDRCPECGRPASTTTTPPSPPPHVAPPPSLD